MKIQVYIQTNRVGSRCEETLEIDPQDLEDLSPEERREYLEKTTFEAALSLITWGWKEIEGLKQERFLHE